jgi:hypothetical protein
MKSGRFCDLEGNQKASKRVADRMRQGSGRQQIGAVIATDHPKIRHQGHSFWLVKAGG